MASLKSLVQTVNSNGSTQKPFKISFFRKRKVQLAMKCRILKEKGEILALDRSRIALCCSTLIKQAAVVAMSMSVAVQPPCRVECGLVISSSTTNSTFTRFSSTSIGVAWKIMQILRVYGTIKKTHRSHNFHEIVRVFACLNEFMHKCEVLRIRHPEIHDKWTKNSKIQANF